MFVLTFIVAMTHVIDFYLSDERAADRNVIAGLSSGELTAATEEMLIGYVREALRKSFLYSYSR